MLNLDITFPETPCSILSLDLTDVTGVHMTNIVGVVEKRQLDKTGKVMSVNDASSSHNKEFSAQQIYNNVVEGLQ